VVDPSPALTKTAAGLESHQHLHWPVVTTNEELRRDGSIIRVRSLLKKSRLRKEKGYEHRFCKGLWKKFFVVAAASAGACTMNHETLTPIGRFSLST
jgi:hypothetical protein